MNASRETPEGHMAKAKDRVLVVDDQEPLRELIGEILQGGGYAVELIESGAEAVAKITRKRPDLLFLDLTMPGMDGWTVVEQLRELPAPPPVILVSGVRDQITRGNLAPPICGFLPKPFRADEVLTMAARTIEAARATKPHKDRRRARRRPLLAEGLLLGPDGEAFARATIVDLSAAGMRFDLGVALDIGKTIQMSIGVPGAKDPIVVQGKIHWSQEGSLGVQFEGLSEASQARLNELAVQESPRG
jgi:CheY-like chemotaxis protein